MVKIQTQPRRCFAAPCGDTIHTAAPVRSRRFFEVCPAGVGGGEPRRTATRSARLVGDSCGPSRASGHDANTNPHNSTAAHTNAASLEARTAAASCLRPDIATRMLRLGAGVASLRLPTPATMADTVDVLWSLVRHFNNQKTPKTCRGKNPTIAFGIFAACEYITNSGRSAERHTYLTRRGP